MKACQHSAAVNLIPEEVKEIIRKTSTSREMKNLFEGIDIKADAVYRFADKCDFYWALKNFENLISENKCLLDELIAKAEDKGEIGSKEAIKLTTYVTHLISSISTNLAEKFERCRYSSESEQNE